MTAPGQTPHDDRHVPLALLKLPGMGRRRLGLVLARLGSHVPVTCAEFGEFVGAAAAALKFHPPTAPDLDRAWSEGGRLAEACTRHAWHLWIVGHPDYPPGLARLPDPPALLFVHGPTASAPASRVAVVGTREPSPWGDRTARECAGAAVSAGAVVVSGLAWGVDTAAHEAALVAGGVTWAVLPGSLDVVFPSSNTALAERIVASGGALVSEYLPGSRPHPTFFIERDRLQAALSDAVVVIETGTTGGTMHTVRFAREIGVPVHVTFPEGVEAAPSAWLATLPEPQQGTWRLLQEGAPRITPAQIPALVASAGPTRATPPPGARGRLFD